MLRLLAPLAALAFIFLVYRAVGERCREDPSRRPWFIAGSVVALMAAGALVPWLLADLKPPWSESPSGILIYLGKGAVVGGLALVGLGALIGALWPGRSET
jgi:hypothetical protein